MQLPEPRSYAQAAVHGTKIFLFGGMQRAGEVASTQRDVLVWDAAAPARGWRHVSDTPAPARSNFGFAVTDGSAYLFGGVAPERSGFRNLDESWKYDFEANRWEALPQIPQATRARLFTVAECCCSAGTLIDLQTAFCRTPSATTRSNTQARFLERWQTRLS
jgi:N-acetylneuraminic acid mutarotase